MSPQEWSVDDDDDDDDESKYEQKMEDHVVGREGKREREGEGKESTSDLMKTLEEISGRHTGTFEYLLHRSQKGVHGEEEQQHQSQTARIKTTPITTTGQRILLQTNEGRGSGGGSRTSRSRRSESARSSASARSSGGSSGGRSTGYDQYGERRSTQFGDVFDLDMDVIRRSRNSRNSRNSRSGGGRSSRWCSGKSLEQIGGATGLFDTTRPHFFQQSSSKSCDDDQHSDLELNQDLPALVVPKFSRASSLSSATFAASLFAAAPEDEDDDEDEGSGRGSSSNDAAAGTTISDSKQQGVEQRSQQQGQQHRQSRNGTRGGGGYLFVMGCEKIEEKISSNKKFQNNEGGIVLGTGTGNGRGRQCVVNDCSGRSSGSSNDDDGNDHGLGGSDLSTMVCAGWSHRHVSA